MTQKGRISCLTGELGAVDRLAARAVSSGEITTLKHELGDHSVEHGTLVPKVLRLGTLLTSAQNSKESVVQLHWLGLQLKFSYYYLKFSAVRGQTSARRVISMRPAGRPPIATSKKTTGLDILIGIDFEKYAHRTIHSPTPPVNCEVNSVVASFYALHLILTMSSPHIY